MIRSRAGALSLLAMAVLTGCQGAAAGPAVNERGNQVKSAGEQASFSDAESGRPELSFTMHTMSIMESCDAKHGSTVRTTTPVRGHFLVLDVSVLTESDLNPVLGSAALNPNSFSTIAPDGSIEQDLASIESYACFPGERMPSSGFQPGQTYRGKIVLDTKNTAGVLVYSRPGGEPGWEWPYTV